MSLWAFNLSQNNLGNELLFLNTNVLKFKYRQSNQHYIFISFTHCWWLFGKLAINQWTLKWQPCSYAHLFIMEVVLHQPLDWDAQTEFSGDVGQKGAVLYPFPPLQLHVLLPLGSPSWLISREKYQQEPHQKSFPLLLLFSVASEQWKGRVERGTGSLGSTAHVSSKICHFLYLSTDHHSHILHFSITPFSSFSSMAITHCQILYSCGLVPSDYVYNKPLCQNPPLSCLSCAQLMLQGSSWLNCFWHFHVIKAVDISQPTLQCFPISIHKRMSTDFQSKGKKR